MDDPRKRPRTLDTISHVFLSCQGDPEEGKKVTHRVALRDDAPAPSKGPEAEAGFDGNEISPAMARPEKGDGGGRASRALRSERLDSLSGRCKRLESRRSTELVVLPDLYPAVKLIWRQGAPQDESLEATAPLHKDVWLKLASTCSELAAHVDASAAQDPTPPWRLVAEGIMGEIHAEEKRERNREAYDSFLDFVAEINKRTDLDKCRKAQMILDKATELELE